MVNKAHSRVYPVQSELELITSLQFDEPHSSLALNRNIHGLVPHGIYQGFDASLAGGMNVLIGGQERGTAVAKHDDVSLTIHQQGNKTVTLTDGKKQYIVIDSFFQYGVKTAQVDTASNQQAAEYKVLSTLQLQPHHIVIACVDVPNGTTQLTESMIVRSERTIGGWGIVEHVNQLDPHVQYVQKAHAAVESEIDNKASSRLKYINLSMLWRALAKNLSDAKAYTVTKYNQAKGYTNTKHSEALTAINTAKDEALADTRSKVSQAKAEAKSYTDTKYGDAIHHTNTEKGKTISTLKAWAENLFFKKSGGELTGNVHIKKAPNKTGEVIISEDQGRHGGGVEYEAGSNVLQLFTWTNGASAARQWFLRVARGTKDVNFAGDLYAQETERVYHDSYHPRADVASNTEKFNGKDSSQFMQFAKVTMSPSSTMDEFITELRSHGALGNTPCTLKVSWDYGENSDLITGDSSIGTIELAGCLIETWGWGTSPKEGQYFIRITRPTTGTGGDTTALIYNCQGSDYSPSWTKIYTNKNKPTAADVGALPLSGKAADADKLDGRDGNGYVQAHNDFGYSGLGIAGSIENWIRSTKAGFLPYKSGGASQLGTSAWSWLEAHVQKIYSKEVFAENKVKTKEVLCDKISMTSRHSTDRASITCTVSGSTTYMDWNLADDVNADGWRWMFNYWNGDGGYKPVTTLIPYQDGLAKFDVQGQISESGERVFSPNNRNITDAVSNTSSTIYASARAAKTAYDQAIQAERNANDHTDKRVSELLGGAPVEALDTIKELGDALQDNDSEIAAINSELAKKAIKTRRINTTGALTGGGDLTADRTISINDATTSQKGAVQLTDSVSSTSSVLAATGKAVKTAFDKAKSAYDLAATKITKAQGDGWWLGKNSKAVSAATADKLEGKTKAQVIAEARAGKSSDADRFDGLDSSQLLRSDADDSFSGKLISSHRGKGLYGTYNSYLIDHIWSMGTSYNIDSAGKNFGNLYGFAYKHTNNKTGGNMAGGHQAVWCTNGRPKVSMGEYGIWTNGTVWEAGNPLSDRYLAKTAKAKDSSNLNGVSESTSPSAGRIVKRDSSGDVHARLFRSTYGNQTTAPSSSAAIMFRNNNSNDNFLRAMTKTAMKAWLSLAKADVGLSNVPNYPATSSVGDSSNSKLATAGAVKKAYDLAKQAIGNKLDKTAKAVSAATADKLQGKTKAQVIAEARSGLALAKQFKSGYSATNNASNAQYAGSNVGDDKSLDVLGATYKMSGCGAMAFVTASITITGFNQKGNNDVGFRLVISKAALSECMREAGIVGWSSAYGSGNIQWYSGKAFDGVDLTTQSFTVIANSNETITASLPQLDARDETNKYVNVQSARIFFTVPLHTPVYA